MAYPLGESPHAPMPRPKKAELSPQVGTVNLGRKRGNPDFVSSSFYAPKQVNIRFDRALLTLKGHEFDLDRSDILSVLMDRFATAVDAAEQQDDGLDLDAILSAAQEGSVVETAGLTYLKLQLQKQGRDLQEHVAELEQLAAEKVKLMDRQIELLLRLVPDELREKAKASLQDESSSQAG